MGDGKPPQLRRGIFGYTSGSVRRMLGDREAMFATSQQRLKESQAVVAQLQAQLQVLQQHASQRDGEVARAAARIAQLESDLEQARGRIEDADVELGRARERLQEADGIALELTAARERIRALQLDGEAGAERARAAEVRVADLETQLASVRAELEQRAREAELRADALEAEVAAARRELREAARRGPAVETSQHVSRILETAERAATRIVELAGTTHRDHLEQLDRVREEIRHENRRLSTWRGQLEPMVHSIRSGIDRVRTVIDDVPARIRAALDPLGEAIDSVQDRLTGLVDDAPGRDEISIDLGPTEETATEPTGEPPKHQEAPVHPLPFRVGEAPGPDPAADDPPGRSGWPEP